MVVNCLQKIFKTVLFICKLFSKNMVACLYHKQQLLQAVSKQRCYLNTTDSYFKLRTRSSALYMESYTWKRGPCIEIRVWFVAWTLQWHYNDITIIVSTMASQITILTIVYSTVYSRLIKENIKAPRHWPLCKEFTGDRWIPRTKGQ